MGRLLRHLNRLRFLAVRSFFYSYRFAGGLAAFASGGFCLDSVENGLGSVGEIRQAGKVIGIGLPQIFKRVETAVNERGCLCLVEAGDGSNGGDGLGNLIIKTHDFHCFSFDINLPAGYSTSESGVLAAFADGQGKLIFGHQNLQALVGLIDSNGF